MCNSCGGDAPDNCCPLCNIIRMAYGGEPLDIRGEPDGGSGPCSVCQTKTTYAGKHNGDYPVWLCSDHGGNP